jgi:hypothetical protein
VYCDTSWHPTITQNGTQLSTIDTTNNTMQWYLNNQPLAGQNGDMLNAVINGTYTLEVTNQYGCVFTSDPVIIDVGVAERSQQGFAMMPNPANDFVTISFADNFGPAVIQVTDVTGRAVLTVQATQPTHTLDVSILPPGTYIVSVSNGEKVSGARLVITR